MPWVVDWLYLLQVKPKLPDTRVGLVGFWMRWGGGWTMLQLVHCTGILSQSRYFKYMQVYALPTGFREVSEFGFKGENTFQEVWKECRQVSGFGVVSSKK